MNSRIRRAGVEDALHVAAIVDIAGHGVDLQHWLNTRDSDHSVLSTARRLVLEEPTLPYHYSKAHIIEIEGTITGGLIGDRISEKGDWQERLPPHLEPLVTLENRVVGYWNIMALAIYPEFRGQGLASKLLNHAAQLAAQSGAEGLSIVVEDTNAPAIAIYTQRGFNRAGSLPWIAYGGRTGPNDWVMLTKTL